MDQEAADQEDDEDLRMLSYSPAVIDVEALDEEGQPAEAAAGRSALLTRREAAVVTQRVARRRTEVARQDAANRTAVWRTEVAGIRRSEEDSAAQVRCPRAWQLDGAHASHCLVNTGTESKPLIFCSRCAGYVSSGASAKLTAECTGFGNSSHLRLLQWGVSPSQPQARLPPDAKQPRWKRQRC